MIPWRKKTCQAIRKWKKWISTFVAFELDIAFFEVQIRISSSSILSSTLDNGEWWRLVARHGETAVVFLLEILVPKTNLQDPSDWQFNGLILLRWNKNDGNLMGSTFKFILVYNTWPWCTARGVRNRNGWKLCLFQPAGLDPRVEHTWVL